MDHEQIRRVAITAMFADDVLYEKLVLKGGNALRLVHGVGKRASLDLDFSLHDDFDDLQEIEAKIRRSLEDRFDVEGYRVFDVRLEARGVAGHGGYEAEFKVIERNKYQRLQPDLTRVRREATTVAPGEKRRFRIQISRGEYCDAEQVLELDDFEVRVYSLEMIAIEKVRALCQQMPEYSRTPHKRARARDFYDIHTILHERPIALGSPENQELFRLIFAAKSVPLKLISRLEHYREFHRDDWPQVEQSVAGHLEDYDYYFDDVLRRLAALEVLWVE